MSNQQKINEIKNKIAADPNNKVLPKQLGQVYQDMQMFDQALKCYQKSLEIDPTYGIAHFRMGDIYMRMHEYESAIKCFMKDIEVRPNCFISYVNVSFLLFASGNAQTAIDTFWKGVSIFPSYQETFNYFTTSLKDFVDKQNVPVATTFLQLLIGHPKTQPQAKQLLKQVKQKVEALIK